jgi:CIC family chloride channel protein
MDLEKPGIVQKVKNLIYKFKQDIHDRPFSDSAILIGTAILVGVGSGLGAVLFTFMVETVQKFAFEDVHTALTAIHPWHLIIIPTIGALITGPIIYFFAREAKGHGVPEVMLAVALKGGIIKPQVGIVKAITSAICIGTGGSVGSEGPIAQIGSALGSTVGQFLKLDEERTKTLVACGAAGGIAAIFNAPIAGAIFAMEVILNRISSVYFGAVVISAVVADSIAHFFMGDFRTFLVPQYLLESPWELLLYSLLAIIAAFASVGFSRLLYFVEDIFDDIRIPDWVKPTIGAILLGVLGIFTMKTTEGFPRIFGVGYESMTPALFGEFTMQVAIMLFLLKLLATLFTLGSGNSGGIFAPSLFMGSMLGAGFGSWVTSIFPNITSGAGAYALVGMASFFSGATHAPMTAILILFEMTNNYQLILPLMLASVLSTIISRIISKDSIYTLKLTRRGIKLSQTQEVDVMQGISVGEVMTTDLRPIRSSQTINDLERLLETTNLSGLPVLETNDDLVGVVTTKDLRVAREAELPGNTEVSRIATIGDLLATHINEPMWQAIFRMSTHDISLLPVVAEDDAKKLVGMIYRQDVIKAYDQAITKKANMQHDVEIIKLGKLDEAKFLHLNIPTNSFVIGKRVSELKLPGHCVIVSIRRGRKLKIVDGQTILRKGDSLTIFSEEECADQIEKILTGQTKLMDDTEKQRSFHEEILIKAGSKAIGKMIKELTLPGDILIVSVLRNQETIIPHGETVIRLDDIVEVYGKQADIETTRTLFEPD